MRLSCYIDLVGLSICVSCVAFFGPQGRPTRNLARTSGGLVRPTAYETLQGKSTRATGKAYETHTLILPGKSVGPLLLGDPETRFFEIYPRDPSANEVATYPNCGTELHWSDLTRNSNGVLALSYAGVITQIEASTPRYRTQDGITLYSSPENVKAHYPGLKAYERLGTDYEANGGRNLIFWVDWKRGIAFSFAYARSDEKRSVDKIIVFPPTGKFCAEHETLGPDNWNELAPYSLEPANRRALNHDWWVARPLSRFEVRVPCPPV